MLTILVIFRVVSRQICPIGSSSASRYSPDMLWKWMGGGLHIVGTGTPAVCDTTKPEKMKRKPSPVRVAGFHVSSKFMKM